MAKLKRQRAYHAGQKRKFDQKIRCAGKSPSSSQETEEKPSGDTPSSDSTSPRPYGPREEIINEPIAESAKESETIKAQAPSGDKSRLMSKTHKIYDLSVKIIEKEIELERYAVGRDFVSVAKKPDELGPSSYRVTWNAISQLILLAVTHCIPLNRIEMMLKNDFGVFRSGQISRLFKFVAELLLPIYLELADSLAEAASLSGDDTGTRTLYSLESKDKEDRGHLLNQLDQRFGRAALKADGSGFKKSLNLSVITGQTDDDNHKSWIVLFRTHFGDLGSLLSKILTSRRRKPHLKRVVIQSDMASWNKVNKMLSELFDVTYAGCMSHARRPIWKRRGDYPGVCYYLLRCFAALARVEKRLAKCQAGPGMIKRYRRVYSRKIWSIIIDICLQLTNEIPRRGDLKGLPECPPDSKLFKAAKYIIRHREPLMVYIDDPIVFLTNNLCERLLRREKMIIASAKFRRTEQGRAVFDILQTMAATCSAAEVRLKDYLVFVWRHRKDLSENPSLYTPYAFSETIDQRTPAVAS